MDKFGRILTQILPSGNNEPKGAEMLSVDEDILLFAFRYALGRHSMAVSTVAYEIKSKRDQLSARAKYVLCRDIVDYLTRQGDKPDRLDQIDNKTWLGVLTELYHTLDHNTKKWLQIYADTEIVERICDGKSDW